jgi:hypothetical protein
MTKGEKKRERKMKKLAQEKLSHFICYRCHEVGHLHQTCPNVEKLKLKKEEERLKRKRFKCHTWGSLYLNVPKQETSEAIRRASTKATR